MLGQHHPFPGKLAEILMRPDFIHLPDLNPDYRRERSCCHHLPLPQYLSSAKQAKETEVGEPRPILSTVLYQI